jgi:membrane fusion protein, multidrug efflux system
MKIRRILLVLLVVAAAGIGVFLLAGSHQPIPVAQGPSEGAEGDDPKPVAQVQTVPIERKTISEKLTTYGSVVAQPGKTHFVALSFESRVQHILVSPGQLVNKGEPLLEVRATPASLLQLQQAEAAVQETHKELEEAKKRFALKLSTNVELDQAQKAASDADLQLESLRAQGVTLNNQVRSAMTGIVAKVDVEDGQVASASAPLLELIAMGDIEIKLGVEPEDLVKVQIGQPVRVSLINDAAAPEIAGAIRLVTQRVNPVDRLVDVFVSVPGGTNLVLGAYVRGEITVASRKTLVVPREAVIPEAGTYAMYVVQHDRAFKKPVKLGIQTDSEVEIISSQLHEGERVVTAGNRELTDGMEVNAT